jgi:hypothetical protein
MYYLDGDVIMIWYGGYGLLSNLESYLCEVNPDRLPCMFIDSLFGIQQKITERDWAKLYRGKRIYLPAQCGNIYQCGKIFIANHTVLHWAFYTIFIQEKMIAYYDSLNPKAPPTNFPVQLLYDWLKHEAELLGIRFYQNEWNFVNVTVHKQTNGVDCGFHLLKNTMLIQMDLPVMEYQVLNLSKDYECICFTVNDVYCTFIFRLR